MPILFALLFLTAPQGPPAEQAPNIWATIDHAETARKNGDLRGALRRLDAVATWLERYPGARDLAWHMAVAAISERLGSVALDLGDGKAARKALEKASAAMDVVAAHPDAPPALVEGGDSTRTLMEQELGWLAWFRGDVDEAERRLAKAVTIAEGRMPEPVPGWTKTWAISLTGDLALVSGNFAAARDRYLAALAILENAGEPDGQVRAGIFNLQTRLGDANLAAGDLPTARTHLDKADQAIHGLPDSANRPHHKTTLRRARLETRAGDLEAARRHLDVLWSIWTPPKLTSGEAPEHVFAAAVHLAAAEFSAAAGKAAEARDHRGKARAHMQRAKGRIDVLQMADREMCRQELKAQAR